MTTSSNASEFWEFIKANAASMEHERNLRGVTKAKCQHCKGTGYKSQGRVDYDGYGSLWVPGELCRHCSMGSVEVPCGPEKEAAAIRIEISKLLERLTALQGDGPKR